jgi:hypothetical protein
MKKLFMTLTTKSAVLMSLASLVTTNKIATANQPVNPQPVDRPDASTTPVSVSEQRVCVRHPKLGKFFCVQLMTVKKLCLGLQMQKVMLL